MIVTFYRDLTAGTQKEADVDLENDTTPLVALNPRIDGAVWHQGAIYSPVPA